MPSLKKKINWIPFPFLLLGLFTCFRKDPDCARPFEGLKFVDVGCGGGILSEVMLQYCAFSLLMLPLRRSLLLIFCLCVGW